MRTYYANRNFLKIFNWKLGTGALATGILATGNWALGTGGALATNTLLNTHMSEAGYKKLIVWQKADKLGKDTYIKTKGFPEEEKYGITSYLLGFCHEINYLTYFDYEKLHNTRQEVGNLLWKFYQSI